tara:strand:+ start:328 stop:813 length:486 start_codon:yes stop_codon:yes gene_type:complete
MSTIVDSYILKLNSIELELPDIARQSIIDNSSEIVLLVKSQLSSGLNSFGDSLFFRTSISSGNGFYAESTQGFADRDNVSVPKEYGEAYNFSWSGETLDNLQMGSITDSEFDVTTVAYKKKLLEGLYGEIFDLTEEHNQYVNIEIILPTLQQYILDNLVQI